MNQHIELNSPIEVMQPRTEVGFFFPTTIVDTVRHRLAELEYHRVQYQLPYVETVYFAEPTGATPKDGYIRLRRHSNGVGPELRLDPKLNYYLEGKVSGGPKERIVLPLETTTHILTNPNIIKDVLPNIYLLLAESGRLFPVAATVWLREHYVYDESNRATIDTQLTYFGYTPGNNTGQPMGIIANNRIEWKVQNMVAPFAEMEQLGLEPIPPKWHEKTIRTMYSNWLFNSNKYQ